MRRFRITAALGFALVAATISPGIANASSATVTFANSTAFSEYQCQAGSYAAPSGVVSIAKPGSILYGMCAFDDPWTTTEARGAIWSSRFNYYGGSTMTVNISGQWTWDFSDTILLGQVTNSSYVNIWVGDNTSGARQSARILTASRTCAGVILKGVVCWGNNQTGSGNWNQVLRFTGISARRSPPSRRSVTTTC